MKNKSFIFSTLFFIIGIIFLILENTFYQYIDENGFLQESWFMPLGFIFIFLSILGFIFLILKYIYKKYRKRT